ncbi:hypothetical protein [Halorubrum gandharaense]
MSEKQFTFLEVHLGDGPIQFGPKAIGGADETTAGCGCGACGDDCPCPDCAACDCGICGDAGADAGGCPCPICGDGCDCVGCKVGKLVVVLGVLAGVAAVAWKVVGETDLDAAAELDELAE